MPRPPRLNREEYRGARTVAFVACVRDRKQVFVNQDELVEECILGLARFAKGFSCNVPIYCFMPDHVHVMMQGWDFESDPLTAMERFKHLMAKALEKRRLSKLQPGFYDHIIRAGTDWRHQARYIAVNPVRAKIVENYTDYPYVGSLHGKVIDLFD